MEKMLFFCLFWWWKGVIFELYDIFNYHHQYKQKCNTYDYFIIGGHFVRWAFEYDYLFHFIIIS
jgi:hypothetical protein